MGTDRRLAPADDIERYFQNIAAQSDRVRVIDLGQTTDRHRTVAAIVSAPENIRNLDQIRADNQRLSDPRTIAADDARRLAASQPIVVAIGCSIHATEVGASQAANELLFDLAQSQSAETADLLRRVVVILIPMLNPDGHRLVVDWYEKHKGTPLEGGRMPWLDHRYAGHDLNRDAFMMNLAESRNLARFFYTQWHPQVFLSMHQMDGEGPRFFAPPNADPIHPNYDPVIWREAGLLGSAITLQLERDGHTGVVSNAFYDYYSPGYEDSAPLGHNTICLLTEAARVKVATPIDVEAGDLRALINLPHPWPGGRWTLRDIVDYDLSAARGLLQAAARYRQEIVQTFYDMGARSIELGRRGGPFAFVVPIEQHDTVATEKLEQLLLDAGVEIRRAIQPFAAGGTTYSSGSDLVFLAQPYRAYVKTLLERQDYPMPQNGRDQTAERPYDVTGWMLPAQMGVDVRTIDRAFEPPATSPLTTAMTAAATVGGDGKPSSYVVDGRGLAGVIAANRLRASGAKSAWLTGAIDVNGYRYGAGSFVVPASKATQPVVARLAASHGVRVDGIKEKARAASRPLAALRVGLYRPWLDNVDEGWTRWVFDQYELPFTSLSNADIHKPGLRSRFDAIVLPSIPADLLVSGQSADSVPAEYAEGLGPEGAQALIAFVHDGGTLVSIDQSTAWAIETFDLPVRDVTRDTHERFFCPGSILRIDLDAAHPFSYGMPTRTAGFFASSSAYEITMDAQGGDAMPTTIATYAPRDLLVSGWLEGESVIAGRAAAIDARIGAGRVVLIGFRVLHRGQSLAAFRLLFNAVLFSEARERTEARKAK